MQRPATGANTAAERRDLNCIAFVLQTPPSSIPQLQFHSTTRAPANSLLTPRSRLQKSPAATLLESLTAVNLSASAPLTPAMDPSKIFKQKESASSQRKHERAIEEENPQTQLVLLSSLFPALLSSSVNVLAPPASGVSRDGSIRRSSFLADGCTYWSLHRTSCVNGECKEEAQKFRQCPNRAREQASVDPQSKQEVWKEVEEPEEVREAHSVAAREGRQRFSLWHSHCAAGSSAWSPAQTPLPFSFRALGGATDDLVSEVMPQFDAMRAEIENDPMFRGLHRVMAMLGGDVPFSRSSQPLPFSMTRGGARDRFGGETQRGESKGGSRDIPIIDASPASLSPDRSAAPPSRENGMRNSALPHPRDLSEDARVQGPIDSIRNSLDRWTNKLSSIVNGTHAPTSQKPRSSADNRSR